VLFNSLPFAIFFVGYLALHTITPIRYRLWLMIVGSTIFYGYWNWAYAGLPLALTLVGFVATEFTLAKPPSQRRFQMACSVAILLTPLAFFKYTNFLWSELVAPVVGRAGVAVDTRLLDLGLPLGISFLTFTLIAYVIDVARSNYPRAPLKLLLCYVLFFPHLIAGPILRPRELIPQLARGMPVMAPLALRGLAVFSLGLAKKMAIADPIGLLVTAIYDQHTVRTAVECIYAFYGFAVQIYCDFSGYTDMAIGLALILGVRLPNNFRQPYCATSIGDFWRRWHITLSHWLRDYVYITLGGSREGEIKTTRNIFITMILGGLWHGANWTFVIWGFAHGVGVALTHLVGRYAPRRSVRRALAIVMTFHVVALLWVLFRAPNLGLAVDLAGGLVGQASLGSPIGFVTAHPYESLIIPLFFLTHRYDDNRRLQLLVRKSRPVHVLGGVAFLLVLTIVLGTGSSAQFIYFDF
jgi:D-alanyl-lipoteichoic acid acyltransferase DltB (MBOAT superfamily)